MAWDWGSAGKTGISGAGIGTSILPGVGTAIGGGLGTLAGGLFGGKGKSKAPDYNAAAEAQSMSSRPNINTPWANQTWTKDASGRPVLSTSLQGDAAPALQNIQANMLRASQYDPTQARDQAVNQNLQYGMGVLQPQLNMQNQEFGSRQANTGASPQQSLLENKMLGDRQAGLMGNVYTNALNMGNQTQQTQMEQMNQPFNQYSSLINSSLRTPSNLGQGTQNLNAANLGYEASRNTAADNETDKQGMLGGAGSLLGGKNKGGGVPDYSSLTGGGGLNLGNYAGQLKPPVF